MNCGAMSEVEILKKASAISFDQEDYNEQYLILEKQTAYENDYEGFWRLVTDDIVLLSAEDTKEDSLGNNITFYEGMPVSLYSDDESETGETDNLLAEGVAIKFDLSKYPYWQHVKWCVHIDWNRLVHEKGSSRMPDQNS